MWVPDTYNSCALQSVSSLFFKIFCLERNPKTKKLVKSPVFQSMAISLFSIPVENNELSLTNVKTKAEREKRERKSGRRKKGFIP